MTTTAMDMVRSERVTDPVEAFRGAEARLFRELGIEAREIWLDLERPRMRARVLEIGEGPPVLQIHGGGGWGSLHAPLAAALPGRRHLLLDRPGFGLSDLVDLRQDVRPRSVELVLSTLDALGLDEVDIIGNSFGSAMAMWFALEHPERVRSLGFAGGAAMLPGPDVPFVLQLLAAPVVGPLFLRLERPSPKQVRNLLQRFGQNPDTVLPAMHALVLAAERVPAYGRAWAEILQATISVTGQRPGLILTVEELARITCPVAMAWGSNDPMVDLDTARAAEAVLPNATLTVTGIGHLPWLDDADAVGRALEPVLTPTGRSSTA